MHVSAAASTVRQVPLGGGLPAVAGGGGVTPWAPGSAQELAFLSGRCCREPRNGSKTVHFKISIGKVLKLGKFQEIT